MLSRVHKRAASGTLGPILVFIACVNGTVTISSQVPPAHPNACDSALGPLKTSNPQIDKVSHTLVCLPLQLSDTAGQPVSGVKLKVALNQFMTNKYLVEVSDFKPVPGQLGLYAGRLPIDEDDEHLAFRMQINADSFLPATIGLLHFSQKTPVAETASAKLVRDLDHWLPKFDYAAAPKALKAVIAKSPGVTFLPLKGHTKEVRSLETNFDSNEGDDKLEFRLARATLLNLFYALGEECRAPNADRWLDDLKQILAIGQERIIALVEPGMYDKVLARSAGAEDDPHECNQYKKADASLHGRNFEEVLDPDYARSPKNLGGHLKTGHRRILQNRPTEQNQDKSSYTLMPAV